MYVDVHAHIDLCKDIDAVIHNASRVGMKSIIVNGLNHENNQKVLDLSKKYPLVQPSFGLYPTDADKATEEEIEKTFAQIKKNKKEIIAIGEIGLDLKWLTELKKQQAVFMDILDLSKKVHKPVIVHSRKAELQVVESLQSSSVKKVVMHCFGGKKSIAKKGIDEGYSFSIPSHVVHDHHFQQLVDMIPLNQIMTETDSPYLSPVPGTENEPANVVLGVRKIAELKKIEEEECAKIIYMNYQKMFL